MLKIITLSDAKENKKARMNGLVRDNESEILARITKMIYSIRVL